MSDSTPSYLVRRRTVFLIGFIILVAALIVRFFMYPVVTDDYRYFLASWFNILRTSPGLTAFKTPFSDYAPLYLYLVKLLTLFPVSSLYSLKTLSIVFEVMMAFVGALLTRKSFFIFSVILAIPTVMINGALWGQSDSLYAAFVLLSLYFMVNDQPLGAVLSFAISFCLKVQSVFFLPVLIGYCLRRRGDGWYLALIPLLYFLSLIPAWLGGGSLANLLLVYWHQSAEYQSLVLSAPTIFTFLEAAGLGETARLVATVGGLVLAAVAATSLILIIKRSPEPLTPPRAIFISLLAVLVIPFLLPRMHERYFYLADVLSVLYVYYHPRRWYIPVVIIFSSFLSYLPYLSGSIDPLKFILIDFRWLAALFLLIILSLLPQVVQQFFPGSTYPQPKA